MSSDLLQSEPSGLSSQNAVAEDLSALQDNVARVLASECNRRAVHEFIDGRLNLDVLLWKMAAELGWLTVGLPEADGGMGLGTSGWDILHRELGRYLAPGPFIATLACAQWLADVASHAQRAALLPRIATGELSLATPMTVLNAARIELRDSALYGQIDMLGCSSAGIGVVPVAGAYDRVENWALVDLESPRATMLNRDTWDRTRQICTLTCEGTPIVGLIEGRMKGLTSRLARYMALAVASDNLGGARAIVDQTVQYLKERVQFDKPVGANQALKHRCADMISAIATNEHLLAQAVESASQDDPDADMWAALAKAGTSEAYTAVAADCVQLHGGVGHTWEFDVHIFVKRSRLNETLVANARLLRDFAAGELATATLAGRLTTELAAL